MCSVSCNILNKSYVPTWLLRAEYSVLLVFLLQKYSTPNKQVTHAPKENVCKHYVLYVAYEITKNVPLCTV